MAASNPPDHNAPGNVTIAERAAARLAAKSAVRRRRVYDARLRVLYNRQAWAERTRDRALDRLAELEREALDAWFLGGES